MSVFIKLRWLVRNMKWIIPWLFKRGKEKYIYMQRSSYDCASTERDPLEAVVGSFSAHDSWTDYDDYLLKYIDGTYRMGFALDFGCGPGRHLIKYHSRFKRLDGCDISEKVLDLALERIMDYKKLKPPQLYPGKGDGVNDSIADGTYDFVMSSITLQHICAWTIRVKILRDIFRILKEGGRFSAQMGYGVPSPRTVPYYTDYYKAMNTNRAMDTSVKDPWQIGQDLEDIGFRDFEHWIRPVGPGDIHPNWIFFTVVK